MNKINQKYVFENNYYSSYLIIVNIKFMNHQLILIIILIFNYKIDSKRKLNNKNLNDAKRMLSYISRQCNSY